MMCCCPWMEQITYAINLKIVEKNLRQNHKTQVSIYHTQKLYLDPRVY